MTRTKRTLLSLVALFMIGGVSIGCETTKGAGEDLQNAGEGMEDALD